MKIVHKVSGIFLLGAFLLLVAVSSCERNELVDDSDGIGNNVRLELCLDLSDDSSSSTKTSDYNTYVNVDTLDNYTTAQRYIAKDALGVSDVYALVFSSDEKLLYVPELSISGDNGDVKRVLTGTLPCAHDDETTLSVLVLINLLSNDCIPTAGSVEVLRSTIEASYVGQTMSDILSILTFSQEDGVEWDLSSRYLPMSGFVEKLSISEDIDATCSIYRSVAKIGVTVDSACEDFLIKEVYVYNARTEGYVHSSKKVNSSEYVQYTEPDVPSSAEVMASPLQYVSEEGTTKFKNYIYVTEADNSGDEPVYLVIGGYWSSSSTPTAISYFTVPFADDEDAENPSSYNILRNHSYMFNILSVSPAGLEVEISDYTLEVMNGVLSQYTLSVDCSSFYFQGVTSATSTLNVVSEGLPWSWAWLTDEELQEHKLEPYEVTDDTYGTDSYWCAISSDSDDAAIYTGSIYITPEVYLAEEGNTDTRVTYFWVTCGQIRKLVTITQDPGETANCYLVSEPGTYTLLYTLPGNGVTKAWADDKGTETVDISFNANWEEKLQKITSFSIIWETSKELITLNEAVNSNSTLSYTVNDVKDQWGYSVFTPGHGGNALIGGFDESGTLIWSWHIWVVADYADGVITEEWVTGYNVIDRYLGAYSSEPGSRSMGLLYQWGRKDPFRGATRDPDSNGDYERFYQKEKLQKTTNYTVNGVSYDWMDWSSSTDGGETVLNSIQHPTTLLYNGFLSSENSSMESNVVKALWGTSSSTIDAKENGVKTMYDPCPPGYRVPSVDAFIFDTPSTDAGDNSYYNNQYYNLRYVPYEYSSDTSVENHFYTSRTFHSDAPFYGFWMNYAVEANNETVLTDTDANYYYQNVPQVYAYGCDKQGYLKSGNASTITWLPIAGIYNGTIERLGRCGISTYMGKDPNQNTIDDEVFPESSIHGNSIIWLNAPSNADNKRPAGVFLHGVEGAYQPYDSSYGSDDPDSYITQARKDSKAYYWYYYGGYGGANFGADPSDSAEATVANTYDDGIWAQGERAYTSRGGEDSSGGSDGDNNNGGGNNGGGNNGPGFSTMSYSGSDYITYASSYNYWGDASNAGTYGVHIHALSETDIGRVAAPQYAGSVRCIVDKDAIVTTESSVDKTSIELSLSITSVEVTLKAKGSWEVTSPGAKWITITPDQGSASSSGITLTISVNSSYSVSSGDTATIEITISDGTVLTITVTYTG